MHPYSRRIIERTSPRFRRPVALAVRTADAAMKDRLPGLAAEIAFWVLLSLPALVLTAIAAASVFGGVDGQDWQTQLVARVAEVSRVALTETTIQTLVVPVLEGLLEEGGVGLISTAAVVTVWTASRAVRVVLTTLTIVYGRRDHRPAWKDRLVGFGITFGALLFGVIVAPLLIAGPAFGESLQGWVDVDLGPLPQIWSSLYWPTTVVAATCAIALLYYVGVPGRTSWLRALPGATLATAVWLVGSAGLRFYGVWIAQGDSAYGPLAGPVVGLLWLWLTGFAVLIGGELNAQIDHIWPRGGHGAADIDDLTTEIGGPRTTMMPDLADATAADATDADDGGHSDAAASETALRPMDDTAMTRPINRPPAPRS